MKAVLLKKVKKHEFFTLTDKVKLNEEGEVLSKYVYVKDEYDRSERRYMVYKFDDTCDYRFLKPDRIVYIDFFF